VGGGLFRCTYSFFSKRISVQLFSGDIRNWYYVTPCLRNKDKLRDKIQASPPRNFPIWLSLSLLISRFQVGCLQGYIRNMQNGILRVLKCVLHHTWDESKSTAATLCFKNQIKLHFVHIILWKKASRLVFVFQACCVFGEVGSKFFNCYIESLRLSVI
jgi:hypothetical protein